MADILTDRITRLQPGDTISAVYLHDYEIRQFTGHVTATQDGLLLVTGHDWFAICDTSGIPAPTLIHISPTEDNQ